jgi:ketosteroid isomerase-like protein
MRYSSALVAGALLFATPAFADGNKAAEDAMMAADRAFSDMSAKDGAHAAFLAYMADDARLFDGDHPPILGKVAAAAYYADVEKKNPLPRTTTLTWTPAEAEASPDGVLGWTRGNFVFSGKKKDGGELKVTGYYVTEWRKGKDGKYKFILDIGGTDAQ